jgi:hypothetical protein
MTRTSTFRGLLVASLLTVPAFAVAAEHAPHHPPAAGARADQPRFDPVRRTQERLDRLAEKLNLKPEQQAAWQAYADAARAHAREHVEHMQALHGERGTVGKDTAGKDTARADMDTATRIEQMSQRMRERAERMQQLARDTRSFQSVLTPEQQTIFDLFWQSQRPQAMMRHRPA